MLENYFFGYIERDSFYHRLSGATKLVFSLLLVLTNLISWHTYLVVGVYLLTLVLFAFSKIHLKESISSTRATFILSILITLVYLLCHPEYWEWPMPMPIALRLLLVLLKTHQVFLTLLLLVFTTHPGQLSASLNQLGVPYRIAYRSTEFLRVFPRLNIYFQKEKIRMEQSGVLDPVPVFHPRHFKQQLVILGQALKLNWHYRQSYTMLEDMNALAIQSQGHWYYETALKLWDIIILLLGVVLMALALLLEIP